MNDETVTDALLREFLLGKVTDEVFDRVAKKVHQVRPEYNGDPRLYFLAVANNLVKENYRKIKTHVSLTDVDLSQQRTTEDKQDDANIHDCLDECLQKLSREERELIAGYYAKEKQAKIDHRAELAQQFEMSVQTLRVRVFRIRRSLAECIERCLERKEK